MTERVANHNAGFGPSYPLAELDSDIIMEFTWQLIHERGRHSGQMVSVQDSGSNGAGSSHCVVFLSKTLYSHSASLHPGV